MNKFELKQIEKTREALLAKLVPGETLLECTRGKYSAGMWSNQEFWIGFTDRRILLINPRRKLSFFSIRHEFICSVTVGTISKSNRKPALQVSWVGLPADVAAKATMKFALYSIWVGQAAKIAGLIRQDGAPQDEAPHLSSIPEYFEQVNEL
jgi:hypothetical protein